MSKADPNKADPTKPATLKARSPRGFADRGAADLAATERMLAAIRETYELYGFEAVETPFVEYTEALGKFLPDQDRPNEGVFSFQDDDEQWLSLRYDLTAPLARYVAEKLDAQSLTLPYRSYRAGWVFRNEKPGPGRFRQFLQFDADTVGSASPAADAEMCMMMADTLERLGIKRGDYVIKVNNRKVLDGVLDAIGLGGDENASRRLTVLRAIDKLDRLGVDGVKALLGEGRTDESGDRTPGAHLSPEKVAQIADFVMEGTDKHAIRTRVESLLLASSIGLEEFSSWTERNKIPPASVVKRLTLTKEQRRHLFSFLSTPLGFHQSGAERRAKQEDDVEYVIRFGAIEHRLLIDNAETVSRLRRALPDNNLIAQGLAELEQIAALTDTAGYGSGRILIDPSVVRGLEYYTGPVFEAELLFETPNENGQPVRFGSVGGGGRYDGLVGRFRAEPVPATGFSIGVSRLFAALKAVGSPIVTGAQKPGPALVLVMDRGRVADYQRMVSALRAAGIRAELYLGAAGMKAQMKYADRRGAPCAIIQGSQERDKGVVQIKDLLEGLEQATSDAAAQKTNAEYRAARLAQSEVSESELVPAVQAILARHFG